MKIKKKLICSALALGLSIGSGYASISSAISIGSSVASDVGAGPEVKLTFLMLTTITGATNDQPTMADLQNSLTAIQKQLSQVSQSISNLNSDLDNQFFTSNLDPVVNQLITLQGTLNETAEVATQIGDDPNFDNEIKAVSFLYNQLFDKKYSVHNQKENSSTETLQQYVENELVGKAGLENIITQQVVAQFVNSNLGFNQSFQGLLPAQNAIADISAAIATDMTEDVGKSVGVLNNTLSQTLLDALNVNQQQNMVAQALIILKKQDDRFSDIDLSGLVQSDTDLNSNDWSLSNALNENNDLVQSIIHDVVLDINNLTISFIINSTDNEIAITPIGQEGTIFEQLIGVEDITYPTADSICQVTSFIPLGNSFEIKCHSKSNKDLSRKVYHATVGNLLQQSSEVLSSGIELKEAVFDIDNISSGIGNIVFSTTSSDSYNSGDFDSNFSSKSFAWADDYADWSTFLTTAPVFISKNIFNNDNVKNRSSSLSPIYEYHNEDDGSLFGSDPSRNDSWFFYLPYSGSFIQVAYDVEIDSGFLQPEPTASSSIYFNPIKDTQGNDDSNLAFTFDTAYNVIPSDTTGSSNGYQAGYNSGEVFLFIGSGTQNSVVDGNTRPMTNSFIYYTPLKFNYKNKDIVIGGNWLQDYNDSIVAVELTKTESKSTPISVTIKTFDNIYDQTGTTIFNSTELDLANDFYDQLSAIVNSKDGFGTINFQNSVIQNNKIEVVRQN